MSIMRMGAPLVPLLLIMASACSGEEAAKSGDNGSNASLDASSESAELAQDAGLANEAAADEAADIEAFGGNAAAMEGNSR
jgi:hypothetical protein